MKHLNYYQKYSIDGSSINESLINESLINESLINESFKESYYKFLNFFNRSKLRDIESSIGSMTVEEKLDILKKVEKRARVAILSAGVISIFMLIKIIYNIPELERLAELPFPEDFKQMSPDLAVGYVVWLLACFLKEKDVALRYRVRKILGIIDVKKKYKNF